MCSNPSLFFTLLILSLFLLYNFILSKIWKPGTLKNNNEDLPDSFPAPTFQNKPEWRTWVLNHCSTPSLLSRLWQWASVSVGSFCCKLKLQHWWAGGSVAQIRNTHDFCFLLVSFVQQLFCPVGCLLCWLLCSKVTQPQWLCFVFCLYNNDLSIIALPHLSSPGCIM